MWFNERFWENPELMNKGYAVIGGQAYSDLTSRFLVFPSYGYEKGSHNHGAILSYCFFKDASFFTGLPPEERIATVLGDL